MDFDVVIIGAGPGGTKAAKILASAGKKVALVEQHLVGGECLHYGCIPSKVFLYASELYEKLQRISQFGIDVGEVKINFPALMERKKKVVEMLHRGLQTTLQKMGVEIIQGTGSILDVNTVKIGDRTVTAGHVILANGSVPAMLPGTTISSRVLNNRNVFDIPELPKSIIIVGGGVLGCEFTSFFATMGVKVTLVEKGPRLLALEDEEIATEFTKLLARKGVNVLLNTGLEKIEETANGVKAGVLEADYVLIGIGRKTFPNVIPGVTMIGDVAGGPMLAYTAEREGEIVARKILGQMISDQPISMDSQSFPSAIFTHPEIASVGVQSGVSDVGTTDAEKNAEFVIGKSTYAINSKALIEGDRDGFAKVIIEKSTHRIAGVHIIGKHATLLIDKATLAVAEKITAERFLNSLHGHPVLSEVLKEAMEDAMRKLSV